MERSLLVSINSAITLKGTAYIGFHVGFLRSFSTGRVRRVISPNTSPFLTGEGSARVFFSIQWYTPKDTDGTMVVPMEPNLGGSTSAERRFQTPSVHFNEP